jgi:glutamate/tyrosine decarboxylase-like PLP-dependent enzyme
MSLRSELIRDAAQRAVRYIDGAAQRGIYPDPTAIDALARFPSALPAEPSDPRTVLALLDELGSPASVMQTNGRYFGFVNGGVDPAAAGAAVLAGAWDQNIALPVMSPVGAHLDALAARWAVQLLGLPATALATFCSGASVANLTCILVARDALLARRGWSVDEQGLTGAPPLRVVTSGEIHISVTKALRAAGIGRAAVMRIPTDAYGRARVDACPPVDASTLVLLQAGNVNTGHSDPFDELIPRLRDAGAWVHVDGAFGLWAAASPSQRHLVAGVELADSWATDAHKWLNAPYDAGLAIIRDAADLRRAMAFDAAYLQTQDDRPLAHLGLQMSQRARGIETWAIIAAHGRAGIAALIDQACVHARQMSELLAAAGVTVLVPTALNQVLVRFGDDATTDAVIQAVQADRTCWVGGTTWQGKRAMRISVCDHATTTRDIEVSADAIVRCWRANRSGT